MDRVWVDLFGTNQGVDRFSKRFSSKEVKSLSPCVQDTLIFRKTCFFIKELKIGRGPNSFSCVVQKTSTFHQPLYGIKYKKRGRLPPPFSRHSAFPTHSLYSTQTLHFTPSGAAWHNTAPWISAQKVIN